MLNYSNFKRFFDIFFSAFLLLLLLPLFLLIMLAIAVDSSGNVIFIQKRAGLYNKPFDMLKFRTMSTAAPANVATKQLVGADTFITPVGRLLRRTSLDELPQLWNILCGNMSFVGPRPVVLTETHLLDLRQKNGGNTVRPGITGLAQVRGRDTLTIRHKARYDAYYAHHLHMRMDTEILMETILCVLKGTGIEEGAETLAKQ